MKHRCCMLLLALLFAAGAASAQGSGSFGAYTDMKLNRGGEFSFNFGTGRVNYIKDGVDLELLSGDPAVKSLPIKCREMNFTYDEATGAIAEVRLDGNVLIDHPDGRITADRAVWNFTTNMLEFEGNPVFDTEQLPEGRAERIFINFTTNEVVMRGNASIERFSPGQAPNPSRLEVTGIKDWPAFLTQLQAEANAEAASPGRHLVSLAGSYANALRQSSIDILVSSKKDITSLLNNLLERPDFYDAEAWKGVTLSQEAQKLLATPSLDKAGQTKLNRLLLEAAYPKAF